MRKFFLAAVLLMGTALPSYANQKQACINSITEYGKFMTEVKSLYKMAWKEFDSNPSSDYLYQIKLQLNIAAELYNEAHSDMNKKCSPQTVEYVYDQTKSDFEEIKKIQQNFASVGGI